MILNKKILYTYIFLFILIALASVLILHHTTIQRMQTSPDTAIDGFSDNATLTEYNHHGEIKTMVSAKNAIHLEKSGNTQFKKPFIITYSTDRTPWHIHADQGISDKNGHLLVLQNNVVIHALSAHHHPETRITTSTLSILPKESRAFTHQAVTVSRPGIVIHGVGLTANFKTGEYQLQSQSKAIYQPWKKGN